MYIGKMKLKYALVNEMHIYVTGRQYCWLSNVLVPRDVWQVNGMFVYKDGIVVG